MRAHACSAGVCGRACGALRNISLLAAGKAAVLALAPAPVLVAAAQAHAGTDAATKAVSALRALGFAADGARA